MAKVKKLKDNKNKALLEKANIVEAEKLAETVEKKENSFEHKTAEKILIGFTPDAYMKIQALVQKNSKEIAWNGTVERVSKDYYIIDDIFVYPQEVSAAFVDTDDMEYMEWLNEFDDDTFNRIRFQGHSHVNMSPIPSATDMENQEGIANQLKDNDFYIFLIANKKGMFNFFVYDTEVDMLYTSESVEYTIVFDNGDTIGEFVESASSMVKEKSYKRKVNSPYSAYESYLDRYYC